MTRVLRGALITLLGSMAAWLAYWSLDNQFLISVSLARAAFLAGGRIDCGILHRDDDAEAFRRCLIPNNSAASRDSVGVIVRPVFDGRAYYIVKRRNDGSALIMSWSSSVFSIPSLDTCRSFSLIVKGSYGMAEFPVRKIRCEPQ